MVNALGQADAWSETTMRMLFLRNCDAIVGQVANFMFSLDRELLLVRLKGIP